MQKVYTAAAAAAIVVPGFAAAQPAFPAYVGPVATYAARGCGDQQAAQYAGGLSRPAITNALCLDGQVTVGRLAPQYPGLGTTTAVAYYDYRVTTAPAFTPGLLLYNDDGNYFAGRYFAQGRLVLTSLDAASVDPAGPLPVPYGSLEFLYKYFDTPSYDQPSVLVQVQFTATPEPAPLALTFGGLAVLGAAVRRRHA